MIDPDFDRAFVAMLHLLGERLDADSKCARHSSLLKALVDQRRDVRAAALAPEIHRIALALERLALRRLP